MVNLQVLWPLPKCLCQAALLLIGFLHLIQSCGVASFTAAKIVTSSGTISNVHGVVPPVWVIYVKGTLSDEKFLTCWVSLHIHNVLIKGAKHKWMVKLCIKGDGSAPSGQFMALQAINVLKETISGQAK